MRVDALQPKGCKADELSKQRGRTAQGRNGDKSNQAKKINTLINDASQRNPSGSCEAEKGRDQTAKMYICTYNTRTLRTEDDLNRLLEEITNLNWQIIGLSETKRTGEGLSQLPSGHWLYEKGKTEDNKDAKGIALLINKNFKDYIEDFRIHSDRIISCKVKLKGKQSMQIIQVYAPTTSHADEEIEMFYENLEKTIDPKCKYHIIMGDFNAKVGKQDQNSTARSVGPHGTGERNERGERLMNFAEENNLIIANTFFQKPKKRMWTWESPNGETRNQIDFILTPGRNIVTDCGVITKADIGSDHRMVRAKLKLNTKLERLKRIKKKKPMKVDIKLIKENVDAFQLELKNRFKALEEKTASIETLNTIVTEEIKKIEERKENVKKEKSQEDKDIEILDDKRKELRKKENKSIEEKLEYSELNKTVKKKRRARERRKRTEMIQNVIERGKGPKEIYKQGNQRKISSMNKTTGETTTDREEILDVCFKFYQNLYKTTIEPQKEETTQEIETSQKEDGTQDEEEEPPPFLEEEIEQAMKMMKKGKAPGNDGITSDILKLGGSELTKYLTRAFNEILRSKEIPDTWQEAKIIILFKKGDPKEIKNYRPISLLTHTYKIFTRLLQNRMEKILDENQPREQAGFRKGFSTTDHLHALNQLIEKSNEYNLPLCLGFVDYEKAFDSVEHFAIFQALEKININKTYINILRNIYATATARIHLDNHVSETFKIQRGVRQGDPISPKLFIATIEEVFKTAELEGSIEIDGEHLTDLRFADDVVLCAENTETLEGNFNKLNEWSKNIGLQIHRGKTKYMSNQATTRPVKIGEEPIEKVPKYTYLGQNTTFQNRTSEEISIRIRNAWFSFGKYKEIFQDEKLPLTLKRKVYDQCILPVMTYGCQTWTLTKQLANKIETAQRAMERRMLNIKLQDRIPCKEIRAKTKIKDILQFILEQKWKWAGHVARYTDNRWTKRCTDWQPRLGERGRGRPPRRWRDDIRRVEGTAWQRAAQEREDWRRSAEGYILQWMDNA